ncbi:type II secretion system F family protein [Micromonospora sp. WMMD708]|uniref:type II secretion system F family protein n=1 Tax=Micromonospora sp. WMMD708 TaxID=3403464 RepID=UPI003BF46626
MTPPLWLVATLLTGAALVVAWPVRGSRRRSRSVLTAPRHPGPEPDGPHPQAPGLRLLHRLVSGPPRRVLLLAGLVGAGTGGLAAGPVAAILVAGYGMLGARAVHRRRLAGRVGRERRRHLDRLGALAADLRAGLPVPADTGPSLEPGAARPGDDPARTDRLARLTRSAVRLADRTGAPLAELLERVEADARAFDRGLAGAAAQAAGANATALLLAVLPLGGIALGYGIGIDPLAVLLHTPVGAGCALAAMGLQAGGLLWAERLGTVPGGGD